MATPTTYAPQDTSTLQFGCLDKDIDNRYDLADSIGKACNLQNNLLLCAPNRLGSPLSTLLEPALTKLPANTATLFQKFPVIHFAAEVLGGPESESLGFVAIRYNTGSEALPFHPGSSYGVILEDSSERGPCNLCAYDSNGALKDHELADKTYKTARPIFYNLRDSIARAPGYLMPSELDIHKQTEHNYLPEALEKEGQWRTTRTTASRLAHLAAVFQNTEPHDLVLEDEDLRRKKYREDPSPLPQRLLQKCPNLKTPADDEELVYFQVRGQEHHPYQAAALPGRLTRALAATALGGATLVTTWLMTGDNFQKTLLALGLVEEQPSFSNCFGYC